MKRIWLKRILWVLLTPILLFFVLMVLLYVPPVQSFICRKAMVLASEATGMDIRVGRIGLRFPLNLRVNEVLVTQPADTTGTTPAFTPDTLLNLQELDVRIQAWPLLKGRVEIDNVSLAGVQLNSGSLIPGMSVQGTLGSFILKSHGVDLNREEVVLNKVSLADTHVALQLCDTTPAAPDTVSAPLRWKLSLHDLQLKDVSVDLQMPLDSLSLKTRIPYAQVAEAHADPAGNAYGWQRFLLEKASVKYDVGTPPADSLLKSNGLNPSHLALRDIRVSIDSVYYAGRDLRALVRECALQERCGLSISTLTTRLQSDSTTLRIPYFNLQTPHSEIALTAQTYWQLLDIPTTGHLSTRLNARIGKQDVMLLLGRVPKAFKESYPFHPMLIRAGTEGNLKEMHISRFLIELPGAFTLDGGGEFWHLNDSVRRSGKMDLAMQTGDLEFLTALTATGQEAPFVVPDSMKLNANLTLEGDQCRALLALQEEQGRLTLDADYHLAEQSYRAQLLVDSLQLQHFLPNDSLYTLTANLSAVGKGFDLTSPQTLAEVKASLTRLHYARYDIRNVSLQAGLKQSLASLKLSSDNALLRMKSGLNLRLDKQYLDGWFNLNVEQADLYKLGLTPKPLERSFAFTMGAEARLDSVKMHLKAGDMDFYFRTRSTLKKLLEQGEGFTALLTQQLEERRLDHAALRRALPAAGIFLKAGKQNPLSYYLATKEIRYDDLKLNFGFRPEIGINGRTSIHGLRTDSLQLDTIFFAIRQDTTRMTLQGGVINGPRNPQIAFRSTLTGEIRNEDAELTLDYEDDKGNTGILFGINARPLTEGHGKGNGLLLHLTPEEPVIAFRKFRFVDNQNWVYLHKNMRVYAGIEMDSDDGLSFRMQSNRKDTVSLQNINIELSRFRLSELSKVIPYMPHLTGLFSAEANYVQTEHSLQVSAESYIDSLTYERRSVGNVGAGVTWLPGESNEHYLNSYLMIDNREVMMADGMLKGTGERSAIELNAQLEHLPLRIANAFMPPETVSFTGDVDGEISVDGTVAKPQVNGSIRLDSVSVAASMVGTRYWFDNRPLQIQGNRLLFDKFAIYTTSENPFTIAGNIDFRNLQRPTASLTLKAKDYTLLNAPRTKESLVYGKIFVDLDANIRGPLDGLVMRGNMNLLGNTNVTYVLTDSPLSVEDRLDGLVTFTSFTDTLTTQEEETPVMSLGGMDMIMSVHIDDAVRLRADLSSDRSKYIELEGGGDLSMQYTPQGDMTLTGRYTLSGGVMKYALPIIPLKEFQLVSGSYVDWRGDLMNPTLDLKATERIRASVTEEGSDASRMVNFDASIIIKNRLSAPELSFDLSTPEDATIENELQAMGTDERNKAAITMIATGMYLGSTTRGGGLTMSSALNSVIQSQINSLAGSVKNASISVGIEDRTSSETGNTEKDFSFRYSQRLFNDRVQIVIGGKVSTGSDATNDAESFIDNVSLEYRLDTSGTRYVRAFYNKNYESVLDGEITETGVGVVLRRKMDKLSELFIFK